MSIVGGCLLLLLLFCLHLVSSEELALNNPCLRAQMRKGEEYSPDGSPVSLSDSRREVTLVLRSLRPSSSLWPWPSLQLLVTDPGGCSSADTEQQGPHCMNERSSVEKGILPEVLPRTWRVFSLSEAGEVYGQWPMSLPSRTPPSSGGQCRDPPEFFKHAAWPQIHFMGVWTSPIPVIQPLTWMLWLQLVGRVQLLPWCWWTGWCEKRSPSCSVPLCTESQREASSV